MNIKTIIVTLATATLLLGCGATMEKKTNKKPSSDLPKVLIIGDSISINYTPIVHKNLAGKAIVYRNPQNARDSANGLAYLDSWLGDEDWAVIHFNHGLHDLIKGYRTTYDKYKKTNDGRRMVELADYKTNLEKIVQRLQQTNAKLVFATTTPVPEGNGMRNVEDVLKYNKVAIEVMNKYQVPVNDLYTLAKTYQKTWQLPKANVHFKPIGSQGLGKQVTNEIEKLLPQ